MKKRILIPVFLLFGISAIGQKLTPQQTKQLQEGMKVYQAEMSRVKKENPGVPDSVFRNMDQSMNQVSKGMTAGAQITKQLESMQNETNKEIQAVLPRANPASNISKLPLLNESEIIVLAKALLQTALPKLDTFTKAGLDKMVSDTATNAAGTGIIFLSNGLPKFVGTYLICKDVIRNPDNEWAVNDLGILYREEKQFIKAIRCFLFAEQLDEKSIIIKTNLAWAAAYYGDFNNAKKYFNEVLAVKSNCSTALEGLALIAYSQGDIKALFDCLMKEVTGFGGGNGSGPSTDFVNICGGIVGNRSMTEADDEGPDPFDEHTFDNTAQDNSNQDPPPGADDEPVQYPSMKPIFVKDAIDLGNLLPKLYDYQHAIVKQVEKNLNKLKQAGNNMPSYKKPPYIDEQGNQIFPYNYEKYVMLYTQINELYDRRSAWLSKEFSKEMNAFLTSAGLSELDLAAQYAKALGKCSDQNCENKVKCEWKPRLYGAANSDLEAAGKIWNKHFKKVVDNCNWYVQATSPIFQRIHDVRWNEYLNIEREVDVRNAILSMYDQWSKGLNSISTLSGLVAELQQEQLDCRMEVRTIEGADPYPHKVQKLKTFAGPCYKEGTKYDVGFASYEDNCDHTKFSIGPPKVKAFFEKVYSKKFKEDDYYRTGMQVSLSAGIGHEEKSGDWSASMNGEIGADLAFFSKYNSEWQLVEKGVDVEATASASGGVKTGNETVDKVNPINLNKGVSIKCIVSASVGQDGTVGPYHVTNLSATKQ